MEEIYTTKIQIFKLSNIFTSLYNESQKNAIIIKSIRISFISLYNIHFLIFILASLIQLSFEKQAGNQDNKLNYTSYSETLDYTSLTNKMRVYYFQETSGYSFTDFNLNSEKNTIEGETYFFTSWTKTSIIDNGIYGGIGFGSNTMKNSDYVMLYYKGNDNWHAFDAYTPSNNTHEVVSDIVRNDVRLISASWFIDVDESKYNGYSQVFYFNWIKEIDDLSSVDDWIGFSSWKTNKASTISAFGFLTYDSKSATRNPILHTFRSKLDNTYLIHGSNVPDITDTSTSSDDSDIIEFELPTGDLVFSYESDWLIPFYNACEFFNYRENNGAQLFFTYNNKETVVLLDIKYSNSKIRGALYLLTQKNQSDIIPYGIYTGLVFNDTLKNAFTIIFSYSVGNNYDSFKVEDIILNQYGSIIDNEWEEAIASNNKNNESLKLIKSGFFIFNSETKKQRFSNYNSMWVNYFEIDTSSYLMFDFVGYFKKSNSSIIGVFNINNEEKGPVFTDNMNEEGVLYFNLLSNNYVGILNGNINSSCNGNYIILGRYPNVLLLIFLLFIL